MSYYDKLHFGVKTLLTCPIEILLNKEELAKIIGNIGLFYDSRAYPGTTFYLYGDDSVYMLPQNNNSQGLWQTPCQLAGYLIYLGNKKIKTYLDIGTLTGWTITVVTAYLLRFGLQRVDTYDVFEICNKEVLNIWKELALPITYIVSKNDDRSEILKPYDVIFIDGDHSYNCVKKDYDMFRPYAQLIVFHDVNDIVCVGVVRLWNEIKETHASQVVEFVDHPNNFKLMGIGVLEC